jgi:hypothetical protein
MIRPKTGMKPFAIHLRVVYISCALLSLSVCGSAETNTFSTESGITSGSTTNPAAEQLNLQPMRLGPGRLFGESPTTNESGQVFLLLPGGMAYEGEARDGKPDGQGTMTGSNGTHQWGEFRDGLSYKLTGTWVAADGTREDGSWNLDGTRSGGTIKWRDGRVYKGDWRLESRAPERPDGAGTMTWPDGRVYVGQFSDGKMDGPGRLTYPDGKVKEGFWKQGEFVNPAPH